jgi:hypothetical protein
MAWEGHGFQPCRLETLETRASAAEGPPWSIYETASQSPLAGNTACFAAGIGIDPF